MGLVLDGLDACFSSGLGFGMFRVIDKPPGLADLYGVQSTIAFNDFYQLLSSHQYFQP